MKTLTKTYVNDWSQDSQWILNAPSQMALGSFLYVQEIGHFWCNSRYYTEHERQNSFLIMLTLSGSGEYRADHRTYELNPGDLIYADCMPRHTYTSRKAPWEILWVHFSGNAARGYFELFAHAHNPVAHIEDASQCGTLLRELLRVNAEKSVYTELISSQILTNLLTEILVASGAVPSARSDIPEYVQSAVREIDAHLTEDLSLDRLSDAVNISKFYLQKEFKKYIGSTPNEYVRGARLQLAKSLLLSTQCTIDEIALHCGFQSAVYFIRVFRKSEGVTPGAYRKMRGGAPSA